MNKFERALPNFVMAIIALALAWVAANVQINVFQGGTDLGGSSSSSWSTDNSGDGGWDFGGGSGGTDSGGWDSGGDSGSWDSGGGDYGGGDSGGGDSGSW